MNRPLIASLIVVVLLTITALVATCSSQHKYFVSYEILTYDNESSVWVIMRDNCHKAVRASSKADLLYELYDTEMGSRANIGFSVDSINIVSSVVVR